MVKRVMLKNLAKDDGMIAALYDGICTVYAPKPEVAASGWAGGEKLQVVCADVPCHLAFARTKTAEVDRVSEVQAECVLFCGAEWEMAPGSRVLVQQSGREYRLALSGLPKVYGGHQEVRVALLDELA